MVRFLQHIRSIARKIFSLIFPQITLIRTFTAIRDTRVGTYNKSGNIGCFRQVAVALTYTYVVFTVFTTLCVLNNPLKRKSFLVLATRTSKSSKSIVISLCRLWKKCQEFLTTFSSLLELSMISEGGTIFWIFCPSIVTATSRELVGGTTPLKG